MESLGEHVAWPVRSGQVPSLADDLSLRPSLAADLGAAMVAGAVLVLVPVRTAGEDPGNWLESAGKTQLAACLAELLWQLHKVELLVWISAASRTSILTGYFDAAVNALEAHHGDDGEVVATRFVRWLRETSRPWLVVLDDLAEVADLHGLWPMGPAGRVIITTANPAAFPAEQGTLIQPVGTLSAEEALNYLTARMSADQGKLACAAELARDLGYEPLALRLAAAVIASSSLSCGDYLDQYRSKRASASSDSRRVPAAASLTWTLSAEHAARISPGGTAGRLLEMAALLDGNGFPASLVTTRAALGYLAARDGARFADHEAASSALVAAERAGLVTVDRSGREPLVRMNAAVQQATRAAAPLALDRAAMAAADALLEAWPAQDEPGCPVAALRSCTASLRLAAGEALWANGCHPLLLHAGRSLDRARLAGQSVAYWSELAAASDRNLGPGHPDTLAIWEQLARSLLTAGPAEDSIERFGQVLAERIRVLGPDHPSTIATRRDLGHALAADARYEDAVTALDRVVADLERARRADELDVLGARDELAAVQHAAGHFGDAIGLGHQTLTRRERVQGPEHASTIGTLRQLAAAYLADNQAKDAITHYKRLLTDSERTFGRDHPDTIAARAGLGSAYQAAGRMAAAIQLREEARTGYERALGADHPITLASAASLARLYSTVGRTADAFTLLRDSLPRCERVLPPGDPVTTTVRESLADLAGG